jgi:hypothetical protein
MALTALAWTAFSTVFFFPECTPLSCSFATYFWFQESHPAATEGHGVGCRAGTEWHCGATKAYIRGKAGEPRQGSMTEAQDKNDYIHEKEYRGWIWSVEQPPLFEVLRQF